jgi:hypothetical protein
MATNNAWNSSNPVEIAKGGTNATSMATSTGIVKYDGTRLVTSSTALIDSSNRMTNTSQPLFMVDLNASQANATGDGTFFLVPFDDVLVDQGSNFAQPYFTAPISGRYTFQLTCMVSNLLVTHTSLISGVFLNAFGGYQWQMIRLNPFAVADSGGFVSFSASGMLNLTAAQQVGMFVSVSGGTKTVTVVGFSVGGQARETQFFGYLVC